MVEGTVGQARNTDAKPYNLKLCHDVAQAATADLQSFLVGNAASTLSDPAVCTLKCNF